MKIITKEDLKYTDYTWNSITQKHLETEPERIIRELIPQKLCTPKQIEEWLKSNWSSTLFM